MAELAPRHQKHGKACFDHVYDLPDPREYFKVLQGLDYQVPQHARRIFAALIARRAQGQDRQVTVADLCCSYGVNAALLKFELSLSDLYDRYCSAEVAALSSAELAAADADFYSRRRRDRRARFVGVDSAANAVRYARRVGLLDVAAAENLESADPSAALSEALAGVDLITVTGGIGYISDRTFDRVLGCLHARRRPWVATFALRMVSYQPLARALARHGLATERLTTNTFPQRRFASAQERDYVLGELETMGIDPAGKEATGWYHATFYLSRSPEQVARLPLDGLLDGFA